MDTQKIKTKNEVLHSAFSRILTINFPSQRYAKWWFANFIEIIWRWDDSSCHQDLKFSQRRFYQRQQLAGYSSDRSCDCVGLKMNSFSPYKALQMRTNHPSCLWNTSIMCRTGQVFLLRRHFSHCIRKNHNTQIVFLGEQNTKVRSSYPKIADQGVYLSYRTSAFKSFLCLSHTTDGNVGFPHPRLVVLPPGYLFFESRSFFWFLHVLMWGSLLDKQTESLSFNSNMRDDFMLHHHTYVCESFLLRLLGKNLVTFFTKMTRLVTPKTLGEVGVTKSFPI